MKRQRDSPPLPDSPPPPRTSPDSQQPAGQPFVWLPQPGLPGYATGLPGPPVPAQLHNYHPGLAALGHPAYQQMPYYHPPPPNGYMDELSAASGGGGPSPLPFLQQQQLHAALAMQAAHGVPLQYMPGAAARGLGPVGFGASGAAGSSIYDGILDPTSIVMPNAPGLGRFAMPMQHLLGGTLPLPLDQYEDLRRASSLPGGPLGSTSFPDVLALRTQQQQQLRYLQPPWQQQQQQQLQQHDELVAGSHQEWPPPRDHHQQQHQHQQQQGSLPPLTLPAAASAAANAPLLSSSSVLQQPQPTRSSARPAASPPQQQQQASAPEDDNDTDDDDNYHDNHDNNNSSDMYTPASGSSTAHSSSIGGGSNTGRSSNNNNNNNNNINNINIHRCTLPDCKRRAIFGPLTPASAASSSSDISSTAAAAAAAASQPLPVRCNTHKEDGQIDLMTPRCKWRSCAKRPSYALPGEKPSYCSIHKGKNNLYASDILIHSHYIGVSVCFVRRCYSKANIEHCCSAVVSIYALVIYAVKPLS
jgi:EsV-1-7 cysteine-rich motif